MPKAPERFSDRLGKIIRWLRGRRDSSGKDPKWDDLISDRAIQVEEEDRLSHLPLARQVAEIAVSGKSATTIGLFGPWGSGKSGLLRLVRKEVESAGIPVVVIDAWKYGEKPLSRQFVTEAAAQLGEQAVGIWLLAPDAMRRWHGRRARRAAWRQLYESRRSRRIRLRSLPAFLIGIAVALAAFVAVSLLGPWLLQGLGIESSQETPSSSSHPLFSAAIVTAVVSFALAALTTESDLNRPDTEEEFERVLTEAVRGGSYGRVVFLVDELDRAPPDEVLATLRTIRTFLDIPDTAFVVAADRDVIELALLHEPTHVFPRSPDNTYSGFAGSYLDKLFQVQIYIPPVRERRLTHMAVRLVQEKIDRSTDCVWELAGDVEEVVSVLLPTHVRSPRRVKVLLNSFATALRVAQIRWELGVQEAVDVQDPSRQLALAKLVCLRTEFPLFARQLPDHPRLTEALSAYLGIENETALEAEKPKLQAQLLSRYPDEVRELVKKYAARSLPVEEPLGASLGSVEPLAGLDEAEEETVDLAAALPELERRRADELLRYLSKTANSPHPTRNLIYGTSLGDVFDLDAEVAAALEAGALDARESEAIAVVERLEPGEQAAAVHLLADLVAKEVGIERRNAMRTLMAIVDEIDVESDLSIAASNLSEALRAFRRTSAYEDEWAEPLLRLSRWLREDDRSGLQAEILDTSSWQESEERVQSVLETAEWWSADPVAQMRESIPELLEGHCDVVVQVLTSLSSPVVGSLWSQEAWIALGENCDELPPFRTLASVLSDVDRVAAWSGVLSLLEAAFEEEAFEVADALGGPHQPSEVRHVLTCWVDGSIAPERWSAWAELLKSSVDGSLLNDDVGKVVGTIANAVESTQLDRQSALDLAVSMDRIGLVPPQDPSLPDGLGEGWWRTGESVERQGDLIQWLESFTEIWGSTRNASNRYRSNAIVEAVSSGEPLPDVAQDLILDELGMGRVVLEEEDRRTIMEHLSVLSPGRHELAYARVWMLALEESDPGPFEVLEQVLTGESDHHNHALAVWIEAGNARPRELWDVLVRIGPARWRPPIADAITAYAHLARRRDATALVRRMVRSKAAKVTVLLAAVDPASINQSEIAREMALLVDAASNSDERRSVLRRCESLGLTARAAQNELISALDRKRLESTSAAADILKAFPKSLISAPGAHKLMRSMETQVKKAGRSDLVRKVAAIWDRKGKW